MLYLHKRIAWNQKKCQDSGELSHISMEPHLWNPTFLLYSFCIVSYYTMFTFTFALLSLQRLFLVAIIIIATREGLCSDNHVQITLLIARKCTVAAAGNLLVQILYSIGNIWRIVWEAISHLFTGQLKCFLFYHFQHLKGFMLICNF